ncbi:hypothetical protein U9M48_005987 [Paspalum notatum var. saurae]|uniref:BHLH domain-containing protein n=1 Tax=Paspalum notatum var. saurae TaxID=547442 RepID=A0AAQ3PTD7_PASNO
MALSFHPTTAPLFGHRLPAADLSFLQDVHPEVTDALLGFVYDPADPALDDLLNLPPPVVDDDAAAAALLVPQHCAKKPRAACADDARYAPTNQQRIGGGGISHQVPGFLDKLVLPLPLPPPPPQQVVITRGGADDAKSTACQSVQSAAARQRRKRISEKTAELSRLIPGGHKMNTAEMLEEAARHVKLLQAQVGVLALMRTAVGSNVEEEETASVAQEQMRALLVRGRVQERLAAAGRCLAPTKLVGAVAKDRAVTSSAVVSRDLGRFVASLQALGGQ